MNIIDPHNLIGRELALSGDVDLLGVGMVLLEEVCHSGVNFEVSYAQDTTQCLSRLPVVRKKDVARTISACMPPCSCYDDNELNL